MSEPSLQVPGVLLDQEMRLSCSDQCRQDRSILHPAAKLLLTLGPAKGWEILENLGNEESEDKT